MSLADYSHFVFISYARQDSEYALSMCKALQQQEITPWIDREGIQPGDPDWETSLRAAMLKAYAVVLIASPHALGSRYIRDELRIAEMCGCPVYPAWVAGTAWMEAIPLGWGGSQYVDLRSEDTYESEFLRLVTELKATAAISIRPPVTVPLPETHIEPRNPYPGLNAFTTYDAPYFFGRTALITELLTKLAQILKREIPTHNQDLPNARLLAVVGPSGSGKSSVVQAGLLPRLQEGKVEGFLGSREWVYLKPFTPGVSPIKSLTEILMQELGNASATTIREDLEDGDADGLILYANMIASQQGKQATKVVLIVDQFEEVFTQTSTEQERQTFIDLLLNAIIEPGGPLIVILTLRADFYGHTMHYSLLHRLIETHQINVLAMTMRELREVIEAPTRLPDVRLMFEGDLVGNLLFDIHQQPGALPLLQFALYELFEQRQGHMLTLRAYTTIGGVKGALTKRAEHIYQNLPSKVHRELARRLFLRLVDANSGEQEKARRRLDFSELRLPDIQNTRLQQETVTAFVDARLLTTDEHGSTLQVSHEALLQNWPRLSVWLRTAHDELHLQQTLSRDAMLWARNEGTSRRHLLYTGGLLKRAHAYEKNNYLSLLEKQFLHKSSTRAYWIYFIIGLSLLLLLGSGPVGITLWQFSHDPTHVTTSADSGLGSLRWAIDTANAGSIITFDPSLAGSTITLTSDDLSIGKQLTIRGPIGKHITITSGNLGNKVHVSTSNAHVRIQYIDFANSRVLDKAFIYNQGNLTLDHSSIHDNHAGEGGGIYNEGTLVLSASNVWHNVAQSNGGGIYNTTGGLTITNNSTIHDNTAADGGGIYNLYGSLTIDKQSKMDHNNSLGGSGGGIYQLGGTMNLRGACEVSDNTTSEGNGKGSNLGGGIYYILGQLTMENCTIAHNHAHGDGGGLALLGVNAIINSCTLSNNHSDTKGGGLAIEVDSDNNQAAQVVLDSNCKLTGNTAPRGAEIWGKSIPVDRGSLIVSQASSSTYGFHPLTYSDFDKYCHNAGYQGATLDGETVADWACVSSVPGQPHIRIHPLTVCQELLHSQTAIDRVANYFDPSTVQCYKNAQNVGQVNFKSYCRSLGDVNAKLNSNDAYQWKCLSSLGVNIGISVTEACKSQHPSLTSIIDRFSDFNDPNSWFCWKLYYWQP